MAGYSKGQYPPQQPPLNLVLPQLPPSMNEQHGDFMNYPSCPSGPSYSINIMPSAPPSYSEIEKQPYWIVISNIYVPVNKKKLPNHMGLGKDDFPFRTFRLNEEKIIWVKLYRFRFNISYWLNALRRRKIVTCVMPIWSYLKPKKVIANGC